MTINNWFIQKRKQEAVRTPSQSKSFFGVADGYRNLLFERLVKSPIDKSPKLKPIRQLPKSLNTIVNEQPLEVTLKAESYGKLDFRAQRPDGQYVAGYSAQHYGLGNGRDYFKRILRKIGFREPRRDFWEWNAACSISEFIEKIKERMSPCGGLDQESEANIENIEREIVGFAAKAIGSQAFYSIYHANKASNAQWKIRDKYLKEDVTQDGVIRRANADFRAATGEYLVSAPQI
jgi:hypothetical protein